MKFSSYILPVLAMGCLLVVTGCEDFLTPEPKSFATTANFYQSQGDFEQAINGVYVEMRSLVGSHNYRNLTDRRGPTTTKHFDVNLPHTVGGDPQTDEFTMVASNGNSDDLWDDSYDLINQANVILSRIDDVAFEDDAVKARIKGEALTMRAFAYWFAGQAWGGVPIILRDARTPEEAAPEGGSSSVEAVYQQVISDLQAAIPGLPINDTSGRITRGAAKFLLGRTYLLTAEYAAALSEFEDLDVGTFPHRLLDGYRDVFDPANKNNDESLWEIQYNPSLAGQPDLDMWNITLPNNAGQKISQGGLLPDAHPPTTSNGWLMPTPDIIASFEEGDGRFEQGIGWFIDEENSSFQEIAWPPSDLSTGQVAGDSLPYLFKYYFPETVNSTGESMNNWVLFRFSDVLLSAAEASWRLGDAGTAQTYLNRVRERAGLGPVDLGNYPRSATSWISTGDALGDAILHERLIELLGEGHAWFDLKRFGSDFAVSVMREHGNRFRNRDRKVTGDMYQVQSHMLLYPIPPNEINLANLQQNPGW
ncbi:MAG: RagB/SusD family nutrient uptake outer membrane protein [Rhodothermales bacterium]